MARRLALSVGFAGTPEQTKDIIQRIKIAEEVGVEAIFTAETWGRDQFSLLTQVALQTEKIKLGTGIAPVFGRSPAVLAGFAWKGVARCSARLMKSPPFSRTAASAP